MADLLKAATSNQMCTASGKPPRVTSGGFWYKSVSQRGISEDIAKLISESLGRVTTAVADVEDLLSQKTDQSAS